MICPALCRRNSEALQNVRRRLPTAGDQLPPSSGRGRVPLSQEERRGEFMLGKRLILKAFV